MLLGADGEKHPGQKTNDAKAQDEIFMMRKNKMASAKKYIAVVKSAVFPAQPVVGP